MSARTTSHKLRSAKLKLIEKWVRNQDGPRLSASGATKENIAFIHLNNPPVNALSLHLRKALSGFIREAENNAEISAIVLCGHGTNFSVGADITEFGTENSYSLPGLYDIVESLESATKPTIGFVNGYALGGGLELLLGCHYRICSSSSLFGFPEVLIGILPGAGGTQRLPRLIGLKAAITWIVKGSMHTATEARSLGLVDLVVEDDMKLVETCATFVKQLMDKNLNSRRLSLLPVADADSAAKLYSEQLKHLKLTSRGAMAPYLCLQAVLNAAKKTYREGIQAERNGLMMLVNSDQARALMYAFFSERLTQKWSVRAGLDYTSAQPLPIKSVAVIGLGTMGRGIALAFLTHGYPVHVMELNEKNLDLGVQFIYGTLEKQVKRNIISKKQFKQLKAMVTPVGSYESLKDVDLVVEAVFESIQIKEEVFKNLDSVCKRTAVLASNTSSFDIDRIAGFTSRPEQVVGMHFFAPAHLMRLLENIYGEKTSPEVIATAMYLGKKIEKVAVLVGNCHGFVGNRMYAFYMAESDFLLEEGAYPDEVDEVLRDFGFVMGRYQVGDLSGNDVGYKVRYSLGLTNKHQAYGADERDRNGTRYCPLSDFLVESGRHGLKTDMEGWFLYDKNRSPVTNPFVTKMIDDYRKRHDVIPRKIDRQEILERMLYPMINEGFKILEEGFASSPSDIDMIWLNGYAWPRHTGGPMYYANTVGLPKVLKVISKRWVMSQSREPHWKPSKMLVDLVEKYGNPDIRDWMRLSANDMRARSSL